jgi:hypothetical protein
MAEDALDRLKNRARHPVPPRDTSLVEPASNPSADLSPATPAEIVPDASTIQPLPIGLLSSEAVEDGLSRVCSQAKITREAFLEAAYILCANQPKVMQDVLHIARQRYFQQQHAIEVQRMKPVEQRSQRPDDISLWLL